MNILFLDIDGVMIPGRSYIGYNGENLPSFDPLGIQIVGKICSQCNAKVVINSTWSGMMRTELEKQIRDSGLLPNIFNHLDTLESSTMYPYGIKDRLKAINNWLYLHPLISNWISLDDTVIDHENAVLVDPMNGISVENYRQATELLGNLDEFRIFL